MSKERNIYTRRDWTEQSRYCRPKEDRTDGDTVVEYGDLLHDRHHIVGRLLLSNVLHLLPKEVRRGDTLVGLEFPGK